MGMYSLIEDAMNKRFDELVASGMTEDEAVEAFIDERDTADLENRVARLERDVRPGDFMA